MYQIIDILFRKYSSNSGTVALLGFIVILVALSVWCYFTYVKKMTTSEYANQSNIPNNGSTEKIHMYFFNVEWCPHCVKAKPDWVKFCQTYDGKEYNGYIIECVGGETGTDCTSSDNEDTIEIIQKFNIEHYPTLKMVKEGTIIDFDGKITSDNLETFIKNILE